MVACIEATIPFRGAQKNPSISEQLKSRVELAIEILHLSLNEDEIIFIIKDSVKISNNDVKGFAGSFEAFVHDSWALVYESNSILHTGFYKVSEYRAPLCNLAGFLNSLVPEKIFIRYDDFPAADQHDRYRENATKNLEWAFQYWRAKIFDTAILEAFAQISGGDCPINLFIELPSRVENHVKHIVPKKLAHPRNDRVRALLSNERIFKAPFPIETVLFGNFIYDSFSETSAEQNHAVACAFFKGELTAENFLNLLPQDLVVTVGDLLSSFVWTRADAIRSFLEGKRNLKRGVA